LEPDEDAEYRDATDWWWYGTLVDWERWKLDGWANVCGL
jgi:hypothetical protein